MSVKHANDPWWLFISSTSNYECTETRSDREFFVFLNPNYTDCSVQDVKKSEKVMQNKSDYFINIEDAVNHLVTNKYKSKKSVVSTCNAASAQPSTLASANTLASATTLACSAKGDKGVKTNCIAKLSLMAFGKNVQLHSDWVHPRASGSVKERQKHIDIPGKNRKLYDFKYYKFGKSDLYKFFWYKYPEKDWNGSDIYLFFVEKGEPQTNNTTKTTVAYKSISTIIECTVLPDAIELTRFHVHQDYYSECLVLLLHYWADIVMESNNKFPLILKHSYENATDEAPVNNYMKAISEQSFSYIKRNKHKDTMFTLMR